MNEAELLKRGSLKDFKNYNNRYYADSWLQASEATPFNIDNIKRWLAIRDKLMFVDEAGYGPEWRALDIKQFHSKYGTNYIFIDIKNKLWRTRQNCGEFYGDVPPSFKEEELE